ncbi:TetR/AcrR family transcriptional regulator [Streptomyces sp. 8K308]|uniref:TetR/AcrR family transcriptional regulator n=1 Tax=Streptomyces sp. 8K308 TaxID=2530388 RepID=UPI00104F3A40|nr:TetR/AcrR family transcriptional regulator [Streptomyces sp. 8K308]TDC22946.1 TetR/AcrR family transcriptional regulator [Streptomyces sp. 8K308]
MPDETPASPVRRPRMTPQRELELLTTTVEVLREVGYEALTMDAVATRAHCSKATLYRQWSGKPQMVAAALYATRPVDASAIDTGTLRGDLIEFVTTLATQTEKDTALIAGLAHVALTDAALGQTLRETLFDPEQTHVRAFIDRAVERGELPAQPAAAAFMPQLLFGALLSRPLLEGAYPDPDYLVRFIEAAILPALHHS